ncbi:DUF3021 family protein [Clostridium disporicum]|uniref:DUF3021 domain-containing protein n=1 Tax=Clostridium disporicum TaxID=84024 RepID=A0A174DEC0_9CLOT|nr:DUF3021 family protein [Clostridium disporicum]MDU6340081.1 DUF3021 family protein [Clostridium sp.]CUO22276.1 Uncharacterised protein [Clostridium disporicum]
MRTFFINSYEIKKLCCLFFAGEVIMYALIGPFIGADSISFSLIWQMAAISILLTMLQYVLYTFNFMNKVKREVKVLIHYFILIGLGYGFAKVFNWFNLNDLNNIIIAVSIFTVCFIITAGSIYIYTKLTGERFNERLKVYKELKKSNEGEGN